jgi:hypothetical protein
VLFLFALLVLELAVIHDPADGWAGGGSDFDEIQLALAGAVEGLAGGDDPDLGAVEIDQPDFRYPDFVVDPGEIAGGAFKALVADVGPPDWGLGWRRRGS